MRQKLQTAAQYVEFANGLDHIFLGVGRLSFRQLDNALWALAVMAFEMMTGGLPFMGPPGLPPRFDDFQAADLPVALRPLVSRALAADPLDRPTSAQEFVDELDRTFVFETPR